MAQTTSEEPTASLTSETKVGDERPEPPEDVEHEGEYAEHHSVMRRPTTKAMVGPLSKIGGDNAVRHTCDNGY